MGVPSPVNHRLTKEGHLNLFSQGETQASESSGGRNAWSNRREDMAKRFYVGPDGRLFHSFAEYTRARDMFFAAQAIDRAVVPILKRLRRQAMR